MEIPQWMMDMTRVKGAGVPPLGFFIKLELENDKPRENRFTELVKPEITEVEIELSNIERIAAQFNANATNHFIEDTKTLRIPNPEIEKLIGLFEKYSSTLIEARDIYRNYLDGLREIIVIVTRVERNVSIDSRDREDLKQWSME